MYNWYFKWHWVVAVFVLSLLAGFAVGRNVIQQQADSQQTGCENVFIAVHHDER